MTLLPGAGFDRSKLMATSEARATAAAATPIKTQPPIFRRETGNIAVIPPTNKATPPQASMLELGPRAKPELSPTELQSSLIASALITAPATAAIAASQRGRRSELNLCRQNPVIVDRKSVV